MLVKIQSSDGGWKLIDNAQEIDYANQAIVVNKESEINSLSDRSEADEYVFALHDKLPIKIRTLSFKRENQKYFVAFSTVVFICDDTGRTLEALRIEKKGDRY